MDSRFAHLRQRDTSVSMLRVKMSRRRSQSQKENRERAVNTRRQLDKLPEMEISSLDASIAMANMSTIQEKTLNNAKCAKSKVSFFQHIFIRHFSWMLWLDAIACAWRQPFVQKSILWSPSNITFFFVPIILANFPSFIPHLFVYRPGCRREAEAAWALERA